MIRIIKLVTVFVILFLCIKYYPYLTPHHIRSFIEGKGVAAPVIFIAICIARPVLFFLPSMGLTVVGGLLFGALWGTIYVVIGGVFSTLVGYYVARWFGGDMIRKLVRSSTMVKEIVAWSKANGKNTVLYMRLFNLPWDMVSYWAGLSGINFKDFYRASLIPLVPVSFLYTYFGSKVFTPTSPGFIISLAIMFIMGALPYLRKKFAKEAHGQ